MADEHRRPAKDRGFTLVELLVTIVISGVIASVLGSAIVVVLRNYSVTFQRFVAADDSLTATNLFPADIAATPTGGREVGAALTSECQGTDPVGSLNVVRLTWSEQGAAATTFFRAAYRIVNDPSGDGDEADLVRLTCTSTTGAHAGFGPPVRRLVASGLLPVPAGWVSGAPAALSVTLDADKFALTLSLDTEPASLTTITGTRMNPARTLPAPPVRAAFAQLRVETKTTAVPFSAVGAVLPFTTTVVNVGTVALTAVSISDLTATEVAINCPGTTLAVDAAMSCTYNHVVTQADLDAGTVVSTTRASGKPTGTAVTATAPTVTVAAIQNLQMTVTKSTTVTGYKLAGDIITYALSVKNTGNTKLTAVTATDPAASAAIVCPATALAPAATLNCTAYTHVVGGNDLGAGRAVTSAATVTATALAGRPAPTATSSSVTVPFDGRPGGTVTLVATPPTYTAAGEVIRGVATVRNTGNVTLSAVAVADSGDSDTVVPCAATVLAPGATTTCTADHVVTADDVKTRTITGRVFAIGTPASGGPAITMMSNQQTVTMDASPALRVTTAVTETTFITAGQILHYTFSVVNTGTTVVTGVRVDDERLGLSLACGNPGALVIGAERICTANYTVRDGDLGAAIVSEASGTANSGGGPVGAAANTTVVAFAPNGKLTVTAVATPASSFSTLGQVITYATTITNTGNVPLTAVGVTSVTEGSAPACTPATLAVGAVATCSSSYTTTAADAAGEVVTNVVSVQGAYAGSTYTASAASISVSSVVPCVVANVTAAPVEVARSADGSLAADVTVTVSTTGRCSPLRVQYYPRRVTPGIIEAATAVGSSTWTYVIPATGVKSSRWLAGQARVDVLRGSSEIPLNTGAYEPLKVN